MMLRIDKFIDKIKETGTSEGLKGSGRPVTATTNAHVEQCKELTCSQEGAPRTHFWIILDVCEMLLNKGANPTLKNRDGSDQV